MAIKKDTSCFRFLIPNSMNTVFFHMKAKPVIVQLFIKAFEVFRNFCIRIFPINDHNNKIFSLKSNFRFVTFQAINQEGRLSKEGITVARASIFEVPRQKCYLSKILWSRRGHSGICQLGDSLTMTMLCF